MKLNFSFYFRQLVCGAIVLLPTVLVLSLLFELLLDEDWMSSSFDDEGLLTTVFVLFLLFLSYVIGILMEPSYQQIFNKKKAIIHFEHFLDVFPVAKDSIISKTNVYCHRNGIERTCLSVADAYRYMYSFIILKSENLNNEVQSVIGVFHMLKSIIVSFVLLIILQVILLVLELEDSYIEDLYSYVIVIVIISVFTFVLFEMYRKHQLKILDAIERNYYLLCKHTPSSYAAKDTEPKVDVEIG